MKIQLLKYFDKSFGALLTLLLPAPRTLPIPIAKRIMIIRPGGIGDAVLLIPTILHLRKLYPESSIAVLAEKRNSAVFYMCPAVDKIFLYDRPRELVAAYCEHYDIVIDTEQWHRLSAVVAWLTKAPASIGYATNERRKLFTHSVTYSHSDYESESFFNLLTPLGIERPDKLTAPFLVIPEGARQNAETMLGNLVTKPFVVIFPGASIPERRWGADRYVEVAVRLYRKGIPVVVVGGNADITDGKKIVAGKFGLNLAGRTSLVETAAVIDMSTLLISGDSGILHIGVGLGKPTVSLFGPGIVKKWAPRGPRHIVINKNLPCSPCTKFGYTSKCSVNARCMADIAVDEVVAAAETLFKTGKAS